MNTTTLYRVYNDAGRLLYVGITGDLEHRIATHERYAPWFDAAHKLITRRYPTRGDARTAEVDAIRTEWPLWNRADSPWYEASPVAEWDRREHARTPRIVTRQERDDRSERMWSRWHRRWELMRTRDNRVAELAEAIAALASTSPPAAGGRRAAA